MGVIQLRPYKKLDNQELLLKIHLVGKYLNDNKINDKEQIEELNQLFREAKIRELSLQMKDLPHRMIYSIE